MENEYYSMDKIARKVVEEELDKCPKGIKHETEIINLKGDITAMKDTNKDIFRKLDGINNQFLVIAGATILQLISIIGIIIMLKKG